MTLVELLAVVVLLVVAAAIVVPKALASEGFQAVAATRTIVSDLQYAQTQAITSQTSVYVAFNQANHSYSLYSVANTSVALTHPITKRPYAIRFPDTSEMGDVRLTGATFGGSASVVFDPLGAPQAAGYVTISAGAHAYRVDVSAATGMVSSTGS
jgi:Tfp pilus assembly protein FimT